MELNGDFCSKINGTVWLRVFKLTLDSALIYFLSEFFCVQRKTYFYASTGYILRD